jgi:hypothetical protein
MASGPGRIRLARRSSRAREDAGSQAWLALRRAWLLRTEIGLDLGMTALLYPLAANAGGAAVVVALAGAAPLIGWYRPLRSALWRLLWASRVRRAWYESMWLVGLSSDPRRGPRLLARSTIAIAELLEVRMQRGTCVDDLAAGAELVASTLAVREVRVQRHRRNAQRATVALVRSDPFEDPRALPWPHAAASRLSLWDPVPVGVDELGRTVTLSLPERNVLLGGEPGAGKSAALSLIVATAALDPTVKLWALDGKLVELAPWAPAAERTVGPDLDAAIDALGHLREVMDERYRQLLGAGLRKVEAGAALPLHLLVCDELALYTSALDRKQRDAFSALMRDLVSRGRAAGIVVCAATQKPSADVVPSALRDLFGFRWALRCNTRDASDTILGQGWATNGCDASTIPGGQRGVGYLHAEDGEPRKIRSFYLDDRAIAAVADRAARLRAEDGRSA